MIAISGDCAYMVSFLDQAQQIQRTLDAEVTIPEPFCLWLDLAWDTFVRNRDQAIVFAHRALSPSALLPSADAFQHVLFELYKSLPPRLQRRLAVLVCKEGRGLRALDADGSLMDRLKQRLQEDVDGEPDVDTLTSYTDMWLSGNPYRKNLDGRAATVGSSKPTGSQSIWTDTTTIFGTRSLAATVGSSKATQPASMPNRHRSAFAEFQEIPPWNHIVTPGDDLITGEHSERHVERLPKQKVGSSIPNILLCSRNLHFYLCRSSTHPQRRLS